MADKSASSSEGEYKLRCTLMGHTSDVRAVATNEDGDVATGSRDKTARLWVADEDEESNGFNIFNRFTGKNDFKGHTGYITTICTVPRNLLWPWGLVITGSCDKTVIVFSPRYTEFIKRLKGLTDTVSCVDCKDDLLVAGSWDHTARVWSVRVCAVPRMGHLKGGHTGPVLAVAVVSEDGGILTASADHSIILWIDYKVSRRFTSHTDCVRGLKMIDESTFFSCSNDATINRWSISSDEPMATYYGHTNFVYSLSIIRDKAGAMTGFVSCSEDRSVRIWRADGSARQVIHLPCTSAWSVAAFPSGDIAVGGSDGTCRVFTANPELAATPEEQKNLAAAVAASVRPAQAEMGGIDPSTLPDKTALQVPGTVDGKTIMVREDDKIMCYSWAAAKMEWEAVGEVVGGTEDTSSGKVLYQGEEYDYVFNVELDEGGAGGGIKLPYNSWENPYMAAQAFIEKHDLPKDQLDQVANFIMTNTAGSGATALMPGYKDPFTGGNRYMPGTGAMTGAGREEEDPLTSTEGYVPGGPSDPAKISSSSPHFPQTTPLLFEALNKEGISNKFKENNGVVGKCVRLPDSDVEKLLSAIFATDDATDIEVKSLRPLETALMWIPESVWPALDLLRLCFRSISVQELWLTSLEGEEMLDMLTSLLHMPAPTSAQLLTLRCLSNLAAHPPGCELMLTFADRLVADTIAKAPFPNNNFEIAAATLLLNCAVVITTHSTEMFAMCQTLSGLCTLLLTCSEPEALYRALVGVGTIVVMGDGDTRKFAISLDVSPILHSLAASSQCDKVRECSLHLLKLLE